MSNIDAKTVMDLRKRTGAPMMDCKAALIEASGDMEKATDVLRKKGLKAADAKAGREATEGRVFSYVHHNQKLGVLVEVGCETDFVARNEEFCEFGKDLCLHVAAFGPRYLGTNDVDPAAIAKEREILIAQARETMPGKPDQVIEKAIEGRMKKFFAEQCLLEQPWVHDDSQTVEQVRKAKVGKIGENIQIRRFVRIELGG
jgi:elongation factor Ts